ncbi:MAG: hypothetical protein AMJ53_00820 [Gammaproteobacteria bacterium SG8_11]|nr:MAG: hypothetical protein AMJ53_00820 [Gammaproteobacteria bacterium SG8_11]
MWRLGFIYIYNKDYQKGIFLIRKAVQAANGSPRDYSHLLFRLAYAYLWMGDYENKVFYPDHHIIPIYFTQYDILFKPLWNNPEFKVLLRQAQDEKEAGRAQVRELVESGEIK